MNEITLSTRNSYRIRILTINTDIKKTPSNNKIRTNNDIV